MNFLFDCGFATSAGRCTRGSTWRVLLSTPTDHCGTLLVVRVVLRSKGLQLLLRKPVTVFTGKPKKCWRGLYCSLMECEKRTWHRLSCDLRGSKQRDILCRGCRGCQSESHSLLPKNRLSASSWAWNIWNGLQKTYHDVMAGCPFLATPRQAVDSWHGRSHEFGSAVLGAWAIWKTLLRKDVCLEIFSICFGGMILWLFFGTQHVHVYMFTLL